MTKTSMLTLSYQFDSVPTPFARGDRALIVLKNQEGKYILGCKNSYPSGIARLPGGGIETGEEPAHAACRELHEELGIIREPTQWEKALSVGITITTRAGEHHLTLYLYWTTLDSTEMVHPSDDLDGIITYSREEMHALVDRFYDLSNHAQPGWADYGTVYGKIHELAIS